MYHGRMLFRVKLNHFHLISCINHSVLFSNLRLHMNLCLIHTVSKLNDVDNDAISICVCVLCVLWGGCGVSVGACIYLNSQIMSFIDNSFMANKYEKM